MLGCYHLALRYIERLADIPRFTELFQPVEKSTELVVLSALLHDVGHYPYSHWIEEIDKRSLPRKFDFPRHEERARKILCGSESRVGRLLESEYGIDPGEIADNIERKFSPNNLVNSFINSIVDVDKVDYLVRDSVHCGVPYGEGIDTERLLDALYVDPETSRICVTEKGKSCVMSIISCRNNMYQEVYWHKTVRACHAMFKRFFFEYLDAGIDDPETVEGYFGYSDDYFINTLWNRAAAGPKELGGLISARCTSRHTRTTMDRRPGSPGRRGGSSRRRS
jgi:HD superfamily phosphohydrolase